MDRASMFRIISFTLAGGDVVQTIPDTLMMYRKCWRNRALTPVCFFYAMARYMTIISLVTNGIGFYGTHFTYATCKPWYMVPNVTAMLAGMAVQILVFIRTFAISGRSLIVYYGLGAILLLGFPIQAFGIAYHRLPETKGGECKGKVFAAGEPDWNIVYYSAHMGYDVIACAVGTFYLVFSSRIQGAFNMSRFIRRVLRNGLLYFGVVFFANLWVVLEFVDVLETGVGATLPLAIVLIAAQHLILSTQRPGLHSFSLSLTDDYSRTPLSGQSMRRSALLRGRQQDDHEGQGSGVFVMTESYTEQSDANRHSDVSSTIMKDEDENKDKPGVTFA
ncbi:putative Transmembrane protein [Mycena venus]|uniref:Putative Transmembrane protein n=1 Tax=Mycena venus TaxID=2733690 RepID=A0A8H6XJY2_9AGAR|nr:putative Transmembrane protein [Mycena venus]